MTSVSYQDISVMPRALAASRRSQGTGVDRCFCYDNNVMVRESLWLYVVVWYMTGLA